MKTINNLFIKPAVSFLLIIVMIAGMMSSMAGTASAADITITYDLNGGTVSPYDTTKTVKVTMASGGYTTIKSSSYYFPGKSIIGWSTSKGGTIKYYPGQVGVQFKSSTTLYAVWGNPDCKITYNPNTGGTVKNGPNKQSFKAGALVKIAPPSMVKAGCTLVGFSTRKDATKADYKAGDSVRLYYDTTLYAIWSGTITYDAGNGGTIKSGSKKQTFISGSTITLSPPTVYKANSGLLGYSTNKNAKKPEFVAGQNVKFDSDVTLYAVWGGILTFNANGGTFKSNENVTQYFPLGESFTLQKYPSPYKPKHDVLGYSLTPGGRLLCKPNERPTLKYNSNTTLYTLYTKRQGKKAIVIFPGILGSNLYGEKCVAYYNSKLVNNNLATTVTKLLTKDYTYFISSKNGDRYFGEAGFNDYYGALYNRLKTAFDETTEYEIILFQYDFRKSCIDVAKEFQREVACQYDKLILIGHSMGGLVASSYLTLANQKNKVEKAFFLGTPFLGSPLAAYLFGGGNINSFYNTPLPNWFAGILSEMFLEKVMSSIPSCYNLIPSPDILPMTAGATEAADVRRLYPDLKNTDVEKLLDVNKHYWVDANYKTHITNEVKSYYIYGSGNNTIIGATSKSPDDLKYTTDGDGIVPSYSAIYPSKKRGTVYKTNADHLSMVYDNNVINYIIKNIP